MKKIVAIVLAMVMVLGLATTAFAATTSTGSVSTSSVTPVKAAWYKLAVEGSSMQEVYDDITSIELTTVSGKIKNDVPMYVPNLYEVNNSGIIFMEVAKADATHALLNNGAYIFLAKVGVYATGAAAVEAAATSIVIDSIVLPADDEVDCGEAYMTVATDTDVPVPYYVSGKTFYAADGDVLAYFNGEFVLVGAKNFEFAKHSWDADSVIVKATDVKGVKVPVSVECENCEKTFSVVYKTAFDNTWVKFVNYDDMPGYGDYYIVLNASTAANTPAAPSAPAAGETVESAKTFDAGIAMYVGMSVMAAAGSAVVLKKKD